MTAEQVQPVVWRISPDDIKDAIQALRNAEKALTDRRRNLNGANVAQWPGYKIHVHIASGSRLFADSRYGDEMYAIAQKVLEHGLRAGVRIEIDW